MSSQAEAVSLPPFFCDGCQMQYKPQGFANHQKKCKKRMEKRERDKEYESNLQALEEEARQARLRSPKRCMSSLFYGATVLLSSTDSDIITYANSAQTPTTHGGNKLFRCFRCLTKLWYVVSNLETRVHRFGILKLVSDEFLGPSTQSPLGSPIAAAAQLSMDAPLSVGLGASGLGPGFSQCEYIFSAFFYVFLTIIITHWRQQTRMMGIITSMISKQNIIRAANARRKLMHLKSLAKQFPLQTRCTTLAPGCRSVRRQNLNSQRSLCRLPCPTSNLMLSLMLCVR